MAWIYLAESEELPKLWMGTSDRLPIVKEIELLKPYYCLAYQEMKSQMPPSGTMYAHSTVLSFLNIQKLSTEDSLAKMCQTQELEQAWMGSEADYLEKRLGCVAKFDRPSSSWRTFQQLLFEAQNELLESCVDCGTTVDGLLYAVQLWELTTDARGGSYWPTPQATDYKSGAKGLKTIDSRFQLHWPTVVLKDHYKKMGMSGQAHPEFAEWLMGYRIGSTELSPLAIVWFQAKRGKRLKD